MQVLSVRSPWIAAIGACLAGLALWHAPEALMQCVHGVACDAMQPGWRALNAVSQHIQSQRDSRTNTEIRKLRSELERTQSALARQTDRVQQLSAQAAAWRETRRVESGDLLSASDGERLFLPALIEAAVLGDTLSQDWREGRVLDRGWKHGVREAALVLQGRGPLIDLGATAQISPEDPLLAGRTIIGKVAVVGRWTSTYLPVTDAEFRGRAQLVRETEQGPVWGVQGLLHGDGNGRCRLDGVPVEAAVRVGDLVYSAERDGALAAPLAYGRVIEARVAADERTWLLFVEPAPQPSRLTSVHVLRAALNPARFWAN